MCLAAKCNSTLVNTHGMLCVHPDPLHPKSACLPVPQRSASRLVAAGRAKRPIANRGPAAFEGAMPKNRRASKVEDTFDPTWGESSATVFPTPIGRPERVQSLFVSSALLCSRIWLLQSR